MIYQFETIIRANTDYARYVEIDDILTMSPFPVIFDWWHQSGALKIAPEGTLSQSGVRQRATSFGNIVEVDLSCHFLFYTF